MRILIAVEPTDFRRGIDGLARVCREELKSNPLSGTVFVFRNKRGTSVKILVYDGQGAWLMQKRLSTGKFKWWPRGDGQTLQLEPHQLQLLLWNGDPFSARSMPAWKPIAAVGE
jgi:transposase